MKFIMECPEISEESLNLVKQLKNAVMIATAFVMIKKARQEGTTAMQFTKKFQDKYLWENQERLNPVLHQKFISSCQDEALEMLKKAIPQPSQPCVPPGPPVTTTHHSTEDTENWLNSLFEESEPKPKDQLFQSQFKVDNSMRKNVQFVESMMRIADASELNKPVPTCDLQSLLCDTENQLISERTLSEDSGVFCSERFSESVSGNMNYLSASAVKYALQSSNANQLVSQSMILIVNHLKDEMTFNSVEVFHNWKHSMVEHELDVVTRYASKNPDCELLLLELSLALLEDIWSDTQLSQHFEWEIKSYFIAVIQLRTKGCFKVLEYISEKCGDFQISFLEKNKHYPSRVEKLHALLNVYCSICKKVKEQIGKSVPEEKYKSDEDTEVTLLWQERWKQESGEEKHKERMNKKKIEKQIETFEVLLVHLTHRYPLLTIMLLQCIDAAKDLRPHYQYFNHDNT